MRDSQECQDAVCATLTLGQQDGCQDEMNTGDLQPRWYIYRGDRG